MNHKQEQLETAIAKAISQVLARGLSDPRVRGLCSVTRVHVSDDRKQADVFISVMPAKHENLSLKGLQAAAGWIGREMGRYVQMRLTPHLNFQLDHTLKQQAEIDRAIAAGLAREKTSDQTAGDTT